jgi:hypothetical protein
MSFLGGLVALLLSGLPMDLAGDLCSDSADDSPRPALVGIARKCPEFLDQLSHDGMDIVPSHSTLQPGLPGRPELWLSIRLTSSMAVYVPSPSSSHLVRRLSQQGRVVASNGWPVPLRVWTKTKTVIHWQLNKGRSLQPA